MPDYQPRRAAPEKNDPPPCLDWAGMLFWVICIVIIIFLFFGRIVFVDGVSMLPTLAEDDGMLVSSALFYEPKQGDIIIFRKDAYDDTRPLVKRVIATEGQTVDIDFDSGIVYVDGTALEEPYTMEPTYVQYDVYFPVTVEDGCVFVLGDNRNNSADSRYSLIGMVDTREIIGPVRLVIFPPAHFGGVNE